MEKLKLRWIWLLWMGGTGVCYFINLAQEAAVKDWHPTFYEVKAPLEDLDVAVLFWVYAGTGLLLYAIVRSIQFLCAKLKKRAKVSV